MSNILVNQPKIFTYFSATLAYKLNQAFLINVSISVNLILQYNTFSFSLPSPPLPLFSGDE
jgi:hypothetical protein